MLDQHKDQHNAGNAAEMFPAALSISEELALAGVQDPGQRRMEEIIKRQQEWNSANPQAVQANKEAMETAVDTAETPLHSRDEYPPEGNEDAVVMALIERHFTRRGVPTLVHYAGEFYRYGRNGWERMDGQAVERRVRAALRSAHFLKEATDQDAARGREIVDGKVRIPFTLTQRRVSAYVAGLTNMVHVPRETAAPFILSKAKDGGIRATEVDTRTDPLVVFRDVVVHVVSGETERVSPRLFSPARVDCDYNPDAVAPQFEDHLERMFSAKRGTIRLAKQVLGAHLAQLGGFQALFVLSGTAGSGKSTYTDVLEGAVTGASTAHTSTMGLNGSHGVEPLVGKSLIVLGDMDNTGRVGSMATSVLKQISGGDTVEVNPKGVSAYSTRINAQVLMVANQAPVFADPSGAMEQRLKYLHADGAPIRGTADDKQNYGRHLLDTELAGIANLAVVYARQLLENGGKWAVSDDQAAMAEQARRDGIITLSLLEDCEDVEITGDPADEMNLGEIRRVLENAAQADRSLGKWRPSRSNIERDLETRPLGVHLARARRPDGSRARVVRGVKSVPFSAQV